MHLSISEGETTTLIHQSELRTYSKVVRFKERKFFRFVVFVKILNVSPKLVAFIFFNPLWRS